MSVDEVMELVRQALRDSLHMSEVHIQEVSLPAIRSAIEQLCADAVLDERISASD